MGHPNDEYDDPGLTGPATTPHVPPEEIQRLRDEEPPNTHDAEGNELGPKGGKKKS